MVNRNLMGEPSLNGTMAAVPQIPPTGVHRPMIYVKAPLRACEPTNERH